jgi:5,10-methylenetetrahydromethanopterin reductase
VAELAEQLGFDTLWLGDSPLIWREPFVTLGYLAARTRRIRLGTGVTNCTTRHVTVQASAWATLSELTGGRVAVGIGLGDSAVRMLGAPPARLGELREAVGLMRALWDGGAARLGGREVRLWPQRSPLPVYLAASGPRTLELAGEIGDGVIFPVGVAPAFVRAALDRIAAGAARGGRTLDQIDAVCWTVCALGPDSERTMDPARAFVASILRHPMPFELGDEDRLVAERIRARYDLSHHMDPGADHRALVPAATMRRFALAGTPAEVAGQIRALRDAGVRRIALVVLGPDWEGTLRTFVAEVLPMVRSRGGDRHGRPPHSLTEGP